MATVSSPRCWPVDDWNRVFPRDAAPADAASRSRAGWRVWAARGEYANVQVGICGAQKLAEVSLDVAGLGTLPVEAVRVRWVGLMAIPIDAFDGISAERPDEVPGWYPDPLQDTPPWNPPARTLEDSPVKQRSAALHLSFKVPHDATPGAYRGLVTVMVAGKKLATIPLRLTVWPFAIPAPRFDITNWFHLDCVTIHHRCAPWSERHWKLLDLYARDMAEHRQNIISTPALIGNFHNSDPMTLVDATLKRDGTWQFDMRRLARWVELFSRHGIRKFELWHMAGQANGEHAPPFSVTHEATGKRVHYNYTLRTDSKPYRKLIAAFLRTLSAWLDRRGLTDQFLLHVFDEPQREHWPRYVELDRFYREHAPKLRHLDAISSSELITKFGAKIEIPVPLTYHLWDEDKYYANRAAEGKEPVWWYTCSGPTGRFANRFVCSPLLNTRMLHWQAFAWNIAGYLHWGHNDWHRMGQEVTGWPGVNGLADTHLVNPLREHPPRWPVGDAAIVYPHPRWWEDHGPISSLRWETMRAGLQDWELFRSLDDAASAPGAPRATATRAKELLAQIRGPIANDLWNYCRDSNTLATLRRAAGDCLAKLV